jgi:glucosamine--fructose-6-phosphate aminotransferase (isomerizing)
MASSSPSQLEREIAEQPAALAGRRSAAADATDRAAALLARRDVDYLLVAARGSSDNAARFLQYLLGVETGLTVALAAPWLHNPRRAGTRLGGAAVLAISQSGRSPDIVATLQRAREQGRPAIALTNDVDSPLAAAADVTIPLAVGVEHAVAATKTFTGSLHAAVQLACALRPDAERSAWLRKVPDLLANIVGELLGDRERFDPLASAASLTAVGRGLQLGTAFETALKIREVSGMVAEAFSPPDLLHGPIAAIGPSAATWLLASGGTDADDERALLGRLRADAGPSVAVASDPRLLEAADVAVAVPAGAPSWVHAILAAVPAQVAALRLGELSARDVDAPLGLTKVTCTE